MQFFRYNTAGHVCMAFETSQKYDLSLCVCYSYSNTAPSPSGHLLILPFCRSHERATGDPGAGFVSGKLSSLVNARENGH